MARIHQEWNLCLQSVSQNPPLLKNKHTDTDQRLNKIVPTGHTNSTHRGICKKNKCMDLDYQKHPDCFREHNRGRTGPSKCVQGGPLPVVSRFITPLIGVK